MNLWGSSNFPAIRLTHPLEKATHLAHSEYGIGHQYINRFGSIDSLLHFVV